MDAFTREGKRGTCQAVVGGFVPKFSKGDGKWLKTGNNKGVFLGHLYSALDTHLYFIKCLYALLSCRCSIIRSNPQYACVFEEDNTFKFPECCPRAVQCRDDI